MRLEAYCTPMLFSGVGCKPTRLVIWHTAVPCGWSTSLWGYLKAELPALLTQTLLCWLCSQLGGDLSIMWYCMEGSRHVWNSWKHNLCLLIRALVLGREEWVQAVSQRHAGLARERQNTENSGAKSCRSAASLPGPDKQSWKSPFSWKFRRSSKGFLIWQANHFNKSISKLGENLEDKKYNTKTGVTYLNRKSWSGNSYIPVLCLLNTYDVTTDKYVFKRKMRGK